MMAVCTRWCALATAGLIVLGGCGGTNRPPTASVSGTVTYKGSPVQGAQVVFMAKEGGSRAGIGTTDAQGKYQLTTFDANDGALLGKHNVTIAKSTQRVENMSVDNPSAAYGKAMTAAASGTKNEASEAEGGIPTKYGEVGKSGLEATVTKPGPNQCDFKLE